ncbi:MAG: hypothetical protein RJB62_1945 [Pseudomonadota bacterium]
MQPAKEKGRFAPALFVVSYRFRQMTPITIAPRNTKTKPTVRNCSSLTMANLHFLGKAKEVCLKEGSAPIRISLLGNKNIFTAEYVGNCCCDVFVAFCVA